MSNDGAFEAGATADSSSVWDCFCNGDSVAGASILGMQPVLMDDNPSIVVVGGFDPLRFHPLWLRDMKLIGRAEAEGAVVNLSMADISEWSNDTMLVQVTKERLYVQAKIGAGAEPIGDLVLGLLKLLDRTRVRALGLNRSMHFTVDGEDKWHRIGHALAPKSIWQKRFTNAPGMRALQIEDLRTDDLPGKVIASVQPSLLRRPGVYFDVNNEIHCPESNDTAFAADVLAKHWSRLCAEAKTIAEEVLVEALL